MYLYLVRHGEPEERNYRDMDYFPGSDLGETGKAQAVQIAWALKDKNISQIFSSDFARSKQTVAPFANVMSLSPVYCSELRERASRESKSSLVFRAGDWFDSRSIDIERCNTAIFSHCGFINVILDRLDFYKNKLEYFYWDRFGCLTPWGGVWELILGEELSLISGKLKIMKAD